MITDKYFKFIEDDEKQKHFLISFKMDCQRICQLRKINNST